MARILYGIMGNTYGHIMRTRAILSKWKGHEIYIVGGGKVTEAFKNEYPILEVPVLRTVHKNQSVDVAGVIKQAANRVMEIPSITRNIRDVINTWQPHLAICDREFFLPLACLQERLRCVSVNHSHVLLECEYPVPPGQRLSWFLAMLNDYALFNYTRENNIVSFYHPALRKGSRAKLFPPVLRPEVYSVKPSASDHILVYQTSPTFHALIESLKNSKRPVIVYGFKNDLETASNITFKPYNPEQILLDLASCAYVIVNGGHNVICEALHFKKPVLCFPIATHFEQFLNSYFVRELGFGDFGLSSNPGKWLFDDFEQKLSFYKSNLESLTFDGTQLLADHLDDILDEQL
jgi:uncharacterized protein (TIGR00661 family)